KASQNPEPAGDAALLFSFLFFLRCLLRRSWREILIFRSLRFGKPEIRRGLVINLPLRTSAEVFWSGAKISSCPIYPSFGHAPFGRGRRLCSGKICLAEVIAACIDRFDIGDGFTPIIGNRLPGHFIIGLVPIAATARVIRHGYIWCGL